MDEIVVQVKDKDKVRLLTDLLRALDFVSSVRVAHKKSEKRKNKRPKSEDNFFALAGIWADREITLTTLRNKAWPRQQS